MSIRDRAQALVRDAPAGLTSLQVAAALGCSQATAASALARSYWAGQLDRDGLAGLGYRYFSRPQTLP